MDKTAMDAFDRGWALGFGTRVRVVDEDFEAALDRSADVKRPSERPSRAGLLIALLAAMGPMARPAH